jgi:hypothetical protein
MDWRAPQIDHVNGGGNKAWVRCSGPDRYYREIMASITAGEKEYQLLCANCNQIKRHERSEFRFPPMLVG